jgi:hypothetical protein
MPYLTPRLNSALRASAIHLSLSFLVAAVAAFVVFGVWYPNPYDDIVGGAALFRLIVGVDVICGPLLTAIVFNPQKPKAELIRDLVYVGTIQCLALGYGLYAVAAARPVHMVFEVDRFRVVTAADVRPTDLQKAKAPWNALPWTGPSLVGLRELGPSGEMLGSLDLSLQGNERFQRPHLWQDFKDSSASALQKARPVSELRAKYPQQVAMIESEISRTKHPEAELLWLPLTSFKTAEWVALIDAKSALPLAYLPLDGFIDP